MFSTLVSTWLIWFILGIALAFVELMMPGFVVLFFGVDCLALDGGSAVSALCRGEYDGSIA